MDTVLFSLLILQGVSDSLGHVWRCHPDQLYVVEATIPSTENTESLPEHLAISLLDMMPTVTCLSPHKALKSAHIGMLHYDIVQKIFSNFKNDAIGYTSMKFGAQLGHVCSKKFGT